MNKEKFLFYLITIVFIGQIFSSTFSTGSNIHPQFLSDGVVMSIKITNNFDILNYNDYIIGNGTLNNPYIIEDLSIESTIDYGIWIDNITAHIIIRNCVISFIGKEITGRDIISNETFHDQTYGIFMNTTDNNLIYNNIIYNTQYGIYLKHSDNNSVFKNSIYNNEHGIYLYNSINNSIYNNSINNNTFGIHTFFLSIENRIFNNTIFDNNYIGIYLDWISGNNYVINNELYSNNDNGVKINYMWNVIKGNKINNHRIGINLSADNNNVTDNSIRNSTSGIFLDRSDSGSFFNNTLERNDYAIYLKGSTANKINHNIINHNQIGIFTKSSDYNIIHGNDINNNSRIGIFLNWTAHYNIISENSIRDNPEGIILNDSSKNNKIINNSIIYNNLGILLNSSDNNLIYNNFFNNNMNYNINKSSMITWNTTKESWWNIVGGPYIGGNYWSNYTGTDTDGDGLGDTDVPFGPGDQLPLVILPKDLEKPWIEDNTTDTPTTGDRFVFNASAWDNRSVIEVFVEYWTETTSHINETMNLISGIPLNGKYSLITSMPPDATKLYYFMSVRDFARNWNSTSVEALDIIDNDLPTIEDMSGTPYTKEEFAFLFKIEDNIAILNSSVDYWYDYGNVTTTEIVDSKAIIEVIPNAIELQYIVWATDTSNNTVNLEANRSLIDNTYPIIEDLSGIPFTGEDYQIICRITDNWEIDQVTVDYWHDNNTFKGIMEIDNETYVQNLTIPVNARVLSYLIFANDTSGNNVSLNRTVDVIDIIKPVIKMEIGTTTTGEEVNISIVAIDNWEVRETHLEYWFDIGNHINISISNNSTILVPSNSTNLSLTISASDSSGNWGVLTDIQRVIDNDPPIISDESEQPTTGDQFSISANLSDNIGINWSYLEYWVDNGTHLNISFDGSRIVNITEDARILRYIISCSDFQGNIAVYLNERLVRDNDAPIINDTSNDNGIDGELFILNISVFDNLEVDHVYLYYWYDNETFKIILISDDGKYQPSFKLRKGEKEFHYYIYASDEAGNEVKTLEKIVKIKSHQSTSIINGFHLIIPIILIIIVCAVIFIIYYRRISRIEEETGLEEETDSEEDHEE